MRNSQFEFEAKPQYARAAAPCAAALHLAISYVVRAAGVEPALIAWKATVIAVRPRPRSARIPFLE